MALPEPMYQNSAGRLLAVLTGIKGQGALIVTIPKLFAITGETSEADQEACLNALGKIGQLYYEFLQDMRDSAMDAEERDFLLRGLTQLQQSIFPTNLHNSFRPPNEPEIALLQIAARKLPQELSLEKDDIEAIRESILALRKLVEDAEISPAIRRVLLDLIRMSEDAIAHYNIRGARGLKKAFKAMLGESLELYYHAQGPVEQGTLTKSKAWAAIKQHLQLVDAVASKVLKYGPTIAYVARILS